MGPMTTDQNNSSSLHQSLVSAPLKWRYTNTIIIIIINLTQVNVGKYAVKRVFTQNSVDNKDSSYYQ